MSLHDRYYITNGAARKKRFYFFPFTINCFWGPQGRYVKYGGRIKELKQAAAGVIVKVIHVEKSALLGKQLQQCVQCSNQAKLSVQ